MYGLVFNLSMAWCFSVIFIFTIIIRTSAVEAQKVWLRDTNFHNSVNWDGWPACNNARFVFPASAPSVFIGSDITFSEMILPVNGELILGSDVSVKISQQNAGDCNQISTYVATKPADWFDPLNWCEGKSEDCSTNLQQPPRLDSERIPCRYDEVHFPSQKSFFVNFTFGSNIIVSRLTIANKLHSTDSLRTYLNSFSGQRQFVSNSKQTSIVVSGERCDDVTGCACGNDNSLILQRVCSNERTRCKQAQCDGSLQPQGHCCKVCGAILLLDYGIGFRWQTLEDVIKQKLAMSGRVDSNPTLILSKTSQRQVQIVLIDNSNNGETAMLAQQLHEFLLNDIKFDRKYGVTASAISISGPSSPTAGQHIGAEQLNGISITGIVIGIILFLLLIVLAVYLFRRTNKCQKPSFKVPSLPKVFENFNFFKFRRFDEQARTSPADFELSSKNSAQVKEYQTHFTSFDNPVYRDSNTIYNSPGGHTDITLNTYLTAASYQPSTRAEGELETMGALSLDLSQATFELHSEQQPNTNTSFSNPLYMPSSSERYYHLQPTTDDIDEVGKESIA